MKRVLAIILVLILAFGLSACKNEKVTDSNTDISATQSESTFGEETETTNTETADESSLIADTQSGYNTETAESTNTTNLTEAQVRKIVGQEISKTDKTTVTNGLTEDQIRKIVEEEIGKADKSKPETSIDQEKLIEEITKKVLTKIENQNKFVPGDTVNCIFGEQFDFPFRHNDGSFDEKDDTLKITSFKVIKVAENNLNNRNEWYNRYGDMEFLRYTYKITIKGVLDKQYKDDIIDIWMQEDFDNYSWNAPERKINSDGSFLVEWTAYSNQNITDISIRKILVYDEDRLSNY